MFRWKRLLALSVLALPLAAVPAAGSSGTATAAPGEQYSAHNVRLIHHTKTPAGVTSFAFMNYAKSTKKGVPADVMFVNGSFGLRAYSLQSPDHPELIGKVTNCQLALSIDNCHTGGFWEGEHLQVDTKRKLVFMTRDPRSFEGNEQTGTSGIYAIDASDPRDMSVTSFHAEPAGHTSACIGSSNKASCQYLWTGGPFHSGTGHQPKTWNGQPVWVTDVRVPDAMYTYPHAVDLRRNDGVTDYVHDTDVDALGIAWTSGNGGVRGYWTHGRHHDPVSGKTRNATPWNPIPYAGGKFAQKPDIGDPGPSFAHNSWHPLRSFPGFKSGQLLFATIENFTDKCADAGKLVAVSLAGSYGGQGWRSTKKDPFRLDIVGEWGPANKAPHKDTTSCSAHFFHPSPDNSALVAMSFYGQGVRFIDISNPRHMKQVGYFVRDDSGSGTAFWHDGRVYASSAPYDKGKKGIDVLRYTGPHPLVAKN